MTKPRLHLDADTSIRALQQALAARGHDVTRTPADWVPLAADNTTQLLGATARGRILFTFNIRDFVALAQSYPHHAGIVLAAQRSWTLSTMIAALDTLLASTTAEEWVGQTRWLNEYRHEAPT
jgi:hypothetical protein